MSEIGIVGYGVVGKAIGEVFSEKGHTVRWCDKNEGRLEDVVKNSEFVFTCLPTPTDYERERIDLSLLNAVVGEISDYADNSNTTVVLKSTIPPGTTDRYISQYPYTNFLFNPEFLTADNAKDDFYHQDRIIIGGEEELSERLLDMYSETFPMTPIYQTGTKEAEMIKYMSNTFLASKVMFANEMYDICKAMGVDYRSVRTGVGLDNRIGYSHLGVTEDRGFSGVCFPKDVVALLGEVRKQPKLDASLLETVWDKNKKIRKKHDWLK